MMDIRTAGMETNHDWAFTRIYADEGTTGIGERFPVPGVPQGEVYHGS